MNAQISARYLLCVLRLITCLQADHKVFLCKKRHLDALLLQLTLPGNPVNQKI
jgi:hypothetical protein